MTASFALDRLQRADVPTATALLFISGSWSAAAGNAVLDVDGQRFPPLPDPTTGPIVAGPWRQVFPVPAAVADTAGTIRLLAVGAEPAVLQEPGAGPVRPSLKPPPGGAPERGRPPQGRLSAEREVRESLEASLRTARARVTKAERAADQAVSAAQETEQRITAEAQAARADLLARGEEVQRLEAELASVRDAANGLHATAEAAREEAVGLKAKLKAVRRTGRATSEKLKIERTRAQAAEARVAELKPELMRATAEREDSEALTEARAELARLAVAHTDTKAEIERLRGATADDAARYKPRFDSDRAATEERAAGLEGQLEALQRELEHLRGRQTAQDERPDASAALELERRIGQLEAEAESRDDRVAELTERLAEAQRATAAAIEQARAEAEARDRAEARRGGGPIDRDRPVTPEPQATGDEDRGRLEAQVASLEAGLAAARADAERLAQELLDTRRELGQATDQVREEAEARMRAESRAASQPT